MRGEIFYIQGQLHRPIGITCRHARHVEILTHGQQVFDLHRIQPAAAFRAKTVQRQQNIFTQFFRRQCIICQQTRLLERQQQNGFIVFALRLRRFQYCIIGIHAQVAHRG